MVAIPSRHRSLLLLTIVVVVQVLMLAVQIQRTDKEGEKQPDAVVERWANFSV